MHRINAAHRTESFQESIIRKMTRVAQQYQGINLAQGFPEKDPPPEVLNEALRAIQQGHNQYSITWGLPALRQAVANKFRRFAGLAADPELEVTITCGCSEAIMASLLGLVNPGERVIVFEPFYENYLPGITLCGGIPEFVRLHDPDWSLDSGELKRAFSANPKALILNTPCNPSGKVFSREEMETIAALCREHGAVVITDEIYEHILYDGLEHVHMAAMPGMWEQTVTISGISKSYSATGWRVGYVIAHRELTSAIRKCHDYMVVCAPTPFQMGAAVAMGLPDSYYDQLRDFYRERRDFLLRVFDELSIPAFRPEGAYYMMIRIDGLGRGDDETFAMTLAETAGMAVVPGSSFYHRPEDGRDKVRFCFAKKWDTLDQIRERMHRFLYSDSPTRSTAGNQ